MISIIIPTFNEEKYIGILLESLSKQEGAGDFEVVVADAFSEDGTRAVAFSYKKYFKNLIIVDGGMPAIGRNRGAAASRGDILFFIDADIVITDKRFITRAEKFFRKHNLGVSTVYLEPLSSRIDDKIMAGFYNFVLSVSKYFRALGAMCIIVDRTIFEKIGGYPEDVIMNEDHDLMLKASRVGTYGVIPFRVSFSVRRFEKEGRLMLILKYAKATYYNVVHGPIKKPIFSYEFGSYEKDGK